MHSLSRNLEKLQEYYEELGSNFVAPGPSDELHPRFFPSIHAYRDEEDRVIEFKYIHPLDIDPACVTFLASTTTDVPKLIVVKIVERYGEEAHRLLAKENLAPQLLCYGKVGVLEGDPSYGDLKMVVMEYVDGKTMDKAKRIPPNLMDRVRGALDILHHDGYVFGDLRQPNIMITKNEEIKLVHFDWAGVHMKSYYPALIPPSLTWPGGVEPFSIMQTKHDDDMFARLLRPGN
jgi:Lipopolysaccharide core biosynthesis protein (WaaY)